VKSTHVARMQTVLRITASKCVGEKEVVAQQMESTLGDIAVAEAELQQLKEENRLVLSQNT
jgi:hypothetical protein